MGEAEPWSGQKGESRRHIQGPAGAGQGWQRESQGEQAEMLSNSRGSPVRSEVAAQPQEQLAFRCATAAPPAPASVNEAAAAAELRDSRPEGGASPLPALATPPSRTGVRGEGSHGSAAMRWSD